MHDKRITFRYEKWQVWEIVKLVSNTVIWKDKKMVRNNAILNHWICRCARQNNCICHEIRDTKQMSSFLMSQSKLADFCCQNDSDDLEELAHIKSKLATKSHRIQWWGKNFTCKIRLTIMTCFESSFYLMSDSSNIREPRI